MIGGDGINDESNKTAPAPSVHLDLTEYILRQDEDGVRLSPGVGRGAPGTRCSS